MRQYKIEISYSVGNGLGFDKELIVPEVPRIGESILIDEGKFKIVDVVWLLDTLYGIEYPDARIIVERP